MPSYPTISEITSTITTDRTTLETFKDGDGVSMRNLRSLTRISSLNGENPDIFIGEILGSGVPASSGTKYKTLDKGTTYINLNTGIWYSKTSAAGATDAWTALNN